MGIAAQPRLMASQSQPNANYGEVKRKYHLASELSQTIDMAQIGENIMDTPIQLSIREVLAVSGDVAGYLHEQTKKRRIHLENPPSPSAPAPGTAAHATSAAVPVLSVNVNSVDSKSYYTLPSGHAKVEIDDQLSVFTTLDNGSEVNMMP